MALYRTSIDDVNPQKNFTITYDPNSLLGTIPVGGSVSSIYDLSGWTNFAIQSVPNGTILGGTVFNIWGASTKNGTYYPLYGTSGTVQSTVQIGSVGNGIYGPVSVMQPIRFIELVAPGTQSAAQTLTLLVK